jgi:DNA-damage-inducible protein D
MKQNNELILFENKPIRHIEHEGEIFYSVVDVIEVLTESLSPRKYWTKLKDRENQLETLCLQLKMPAADGKNYRTDCANTEGIFRLIMSVPSPKAEPFKQWLAQNGKQTIDEAENPELGIERIIEMYKARGNSDEWIKNRLQSIETRKALTDEWKQRGVNEGQEYAILTATIAKGTFGLSPSEHSNLKGLERQNLRDHMTPLELIFTALGEEITRSESVDMDAQGFNENHEAAQKGGSLAGKARLLVEKERGKKVVSSDNFLGLNANKNETKELNKDEDKTE